MIKIAYESNSFVSWLKNLDFYITFITRSIWAGTHFINLWRINDWVDVRRADWFWNKKNWIDNPEP